MCTFLLSCILSNVWWPNDVFYNVYFGISCLKTSCLKQLKYKEEYEKNKGRNFTEIPETSEMVLSKELRPVQSKKLYEEKSKEMRKNVSVPAGELVSSFVNSFLII